MTDEQIMDGMAEQFDLGIQIGELRVITAQESATKMRMMLNLILNQIKDGGKHLSVSDFVQMAMENDFDISSLFGKPDWEYTRDEVLGLWSKGEMTEGGASRLLKLSRIQARVALEEWEALVQPPTASE